MLLINYICNGAKLDGCAIEHKTGRPFIFAHRLVQKGQRLHHGRFPGSILTGKQRQGTQRQLQ